VWTIAIVTDPVLFEQHSCLVDAGEELSVEKLIAQTTVCSM
jgi:hypothetical protein